MSHEDNLEVKKTYLKVVSYHLWPPETNLELEKSFLMLLCCCLVAINGLLNERNRFGGMKKTKTRYKPCHKSWADLMHD